MGKRLGLRQWIALKLFKKLHKIRAKEHRLTTLFWECTLRCNLKCRHCGSDCTVNPEFKDMAEDIYQFIQLKGLERPAIFGFSDGGIVALQLEVMHPGTLSAIATGGSNIFVKDALQPDFSEWFLNQPDPSPLTRMMMVEPNMSPEDMQTIMIPALIMAGENDLIREEHTRLIGESIPNGEVLIVENADHGSYIYHNTFVGEKLLEFFNRIGY